MLPSLVDRVDFYDYLNFTEPPQLLPSVPTTLHTNVGRQIDVMCPIFGVNVDAITGEMVVVPAKW
jgi:hypothetical protein